MHGVGNATALRISDLDVSLGSRRVLQDVSFTVDARSTFAVIGGSGCGKTTLLRAIAGLTPIERGRIEVDGRPVEGLAPNRRDVVYLNQEPLLFPHLNLFENLAFGLRLRRRPREEIAVRVDALLSALDLRGLEARQPQALSGGQKQRAAFGRALAVEPAMMLLDEPFGSLDPTTRESMQDLFKQVSRERGITAVFVTHDLKESLRVGDQFAALRDGRCCVYADRAAFCRDPATGVARETAFWSASVEP